jgi:hypothetical protein
MKLIMVSVTQQCLKLPDSISKPFVLTVQQYWPITRWLSTQIKVLEELPSPGKDRLTNMVINYSFMQRTKLEHICFFFKLLPSFLEDSTWRI